MFKNWLKKRAPHEAAWPSLPESGFMLGRVATAEDIDLGDAVFSQATNDGLKAEPYPTTIPQYALWQDEDGSTRPVFVLQAEKHMSDPTGKPIYGLRTLMVKRSSHRVKRFGCSERFHRRRNVR